MSVEMTPDEERERTRDLLEKMGKHVAMAAFVAPPPSTPHDISNNGTVSFIELPCGKMIVTNHHVWHTFCDDREQTPGLRLAIMGEGFERPLDISTCELIDSDEGIDLAVLRFQYPEFIESVGKGFYKPKRWPLDTPEVGDDVAFVGFPGNRKTPTDEYLRFQSVLLAPRVTAVSDRKMLLGFNQTELITHNYSTMPLDDLRWGGMSGSMVYRADPKLNQFFVTGFFHASGGGLTGSLFAARADLIQEDGTLRRN